jgi:hypothetical protein
MENVIMAAIAGQRTGALARLWERPYSNPDFLTLEGGEAKNCLRPDEGGSSFFRAPGEVKKS